MKKFKTVATNVIKVDGYSQVTGQAQYVDDIDLKDMLQIKLLTSPHPHAVIEELDTSAAEKLPGVELVLTYKNVPMVPHTTAGQGYPEPSPYDTYMFSQKVRYVGDRVAAVAAVSEAIAEEALGLIKVKYKQLDPVFDLEKALDPGAPIIHDEKESTGIFDAKRNLPSHTEAEFGDLQKAFKESDAIIENSYYYHYAQHVPIEPHITICYMDEKNRIIIRTSTQVPFHVRRIVAQCLQIPVSKIRVIKPRVGGAFGVKQEILLEDITAMVTYKTGKPARFNFARREEFSISRTRHPMKIRMKIGATKDGKIIADQMYVLSNTGAYGSHALTVASNAASKVLPLYPTDNVKFTTDVVYTNLPVGGAYRGYGGTQGHFAQECAIDELAEKLNMDPLEFRIKNHINKGGTSPIFKAIGEGKEGTEMYINSCGLPQCIKLGAKEIEWKKMRKIKDKGRYRRGVGCCILMQGSSIPYVDMGAAFIKMNEDGSFNLQIGATDLGTGSDTVLAQIAAEVLEVPVEKMIVYSSDTDMTPFDVGAYASSTTYLSGMAVKKCAEKVKKQVLEVGAKMLSLKPKDVEIDDGYVIQTGTGKKVSYSEISNYSLYANEQFQIMDTASSISYESPPPFSAHFALVEVDIFTGKIKVLKYVTAVDCGTAIHPRLAEGQAEGAVINALSSALTEEYIFADNGRLLNNNFWDYKIFSAMDIPEFKTILVPTYEKSGPYGAKSVSEICTNGPAPVVSNAVAHAIGIRLRNTPFRPDVVLEEIEKAGIK